MVTGGCSRPAAIVPVMDILDGAVVGAVAGRRDEYGPISSPLLSSAEPLHFVERINEAFGFGLFYVADLDAIMERGSNAAVVEALIAGTPFHFWLDGGFRDESDIPMRDRLTPVVATETFQRWDAPGDLSGAVVSIDTKDGALLGAGTSLTQETALHCAREAGAKRFIHLRLESVGAGGFDPSALIQPGPGEEWYAAGGVRAREDLDKLARLGYTGALVSTALHAGTLP